MTRRRAAFAVALASLATFLVVVALLAAQLSVGHDPALGSGARVVTLANGGHRVVTRTSGSSATAAPRASTHHVTTRTSGGGEQGDE